MMNAQTDKGQTLQRFVKILDCFSQDRPELGVREVARLVDLSTSATGRLMVSMKDLGILNQNPVTKYYSVGPRMLSWAGIYLSTSDIRNVAYPYLQELHHATQETISLYILEGCERVCIERLESTQNVRFVAPRVGRRLPLHAGSAGKVLLAFLDTTRCEEILSSGELARLTEKTIVDPTVLRCELEAVRQNGYAISSGEWILDAAGIAAPVFDRSGQANAALTISGPAQRFTPEIFPKYVDPLIRVARQISLAMGYHSVPSNASLSAWKG